MYEEKGFSLTNLLIKLISAIVFILVIVWLVSLTNKGMSNSLEVITDNLFAENLDKMKEVGKEYFTIERLPKNIGESNKITLEEMYDKHLLLEVKDGSGKVCSAGKSYISVEKFENEYQMKVYLECDGKSEYILAVMGCYDYCDSDICEFNPNNKKEKEVEYQYVLTTGGKWSSYGSWSNWSTNVAKKSISKQVETKTELVENNTVKDVLKNVDVAYSMKCPAGYTSNGIKCVKRIVNTLKSEPIACPSKSGYTVSQNGLECVYTKTYVPTCESTYNGYKLVSQNGLTCNYAKESSYRSGRTYINTKTGNSMPSNTNTYEYEFVSSDDVLSCSTACSMKTIVTYKVYKINYATKSSKTNKSLTCPNEYDTINNKCVKKLIETTTCPTGYNENNNSCVKTEISNDYTALINYCPAGTKEKEDNTGCYKTITVQETVTNSKKITYYRFRIREYIGGTTTYKWSFSKNDQNLLKAGYTLTGKTR